jgi:DNA-binding protein YbaB
MHITNLSEVQEANRGGMLQEVIHGEVTATAIAIDMEIVDPDGDVLILMEDMVDQTYHL